MYWSPVQNTADFKRQAFQAHLILSHIETLLPLQLFISELWKFSNVRRSLIVTFVLNNSHSWTRSNSSEFSSLPQGPLLGVEGLRQDLVPCRFGLPQLEPEIYLVKQAKRVQLHKKDLPYSVLKLLLCCSSAWSKIIWSKEPQLGKTFSSHDVKCHPSYQIGQES